jgi:2-oxoisovalerate dehydrogenase E2 component (dihydrolipoyl transacylase)
MPIQTLTTVTMPQLGESVTEGTIGEWLKQVGERVEKYEPLVEVETDKVNSEIPAPVSGTVLELLVEPQTTVPVGAALCRIDEADSATTTVPDAAHVKTAPAITGERNGDAHALDEMELLRRRSSPVVRRIAEEHGVDLGQIAGTGIEGRVTKQDILAFLAVQPEPEPTAAPVPVVPPQPSEPSPMATPSAPSVAKSTSRLEIFPGDEVIPVSAMRRRIAEHMVLSERTAPHATVVMEVDMTGAVAYREAHKEEFRQREGIDLTYLPFAIKAVTLALRTFPRLNAVWDEGRIIHRGSINVGVAVALDDGLIVPVVRHADRLSVTGLMHAVVDLASKARSGALAPDDITGGTFTINNPGTFGSVVSTPILVQPQVAILSTEAIIKRPVIIGDMIAVRSMMNLSLSIDHRVLDGLVAAQFLQAVKAWLEEINVDSSLDA